MVGLTCCTKHATLVVILRIYKLGRNSISRAARTKMLACRSPLRIGVTTLNHKILYHAMKERVVIVSLTRQLEKVITMFGSLIIEAHHDVSIVGTDTYHRCC